VVNSLAFTLMGGNYPIHRRRPVQLSSDEMRRNYSKRSFTHCASPFPHLLVPVSNRRTLKALRWRWWRRWFLLIYLCYLFIYVIYLFTMTTMMM